MTTIPKPTDLANGYTATYDAWNRLVKVTSGGANVQVNAYDGLHRRIVRTTGTNSPRHFYYNEAWQVLEERFGTATTADKQFVCHPYYIDAVAVSYRAAIDSTLT